MDQTIFIMFFFILQINSTDLYFYSYAKGDLDISYITSRIAGRYPPLPSTLHNSFTVEVKPTDVFCVVMSYPAEGVESAIKNNIEDVRLFLDSRHAGHYAVYNLSRRSYRPSRFHNRVCIVFAHMPYWLPPNNYWSCPLITPSFTLCVQVSECNWQLRRAPNLRSLYSVCKNMHLWLKQDQRNICIVHCLVREADRVTHLTSSYCEGENSSNFSSRFASYRMAKQHQLWRFVPSCVSVAFLPQLRQPSTCSQWSAAHLVYHPHTRGTNM